MKYMTVTDVKDRWGVSSDVVYDYIAAGRLKAVNSDALGVSSSLIWRRLSATSIQRTQRSFVRAEQEALCNAQGYCSCSACSGNHTGNLLCNLHGGSRCAGEIRRYYFMITFISGMAAGAAALLGIFKVCFVRWERMERNKRRRAKRAAQRKKAVKQIGFCGDIRRDNTWMRETTRL